MKINKVIKVVFVVALVAFNLVFTVSKSDSSKLVNLENISSAKADGEMFTHCHWQRCPGCNDGSSYFCGYEPELELVCTCGSFC